MSDTRGPLEKAYDDRIAPLMTQIIEIAQAEGIPMYATFVLDEREENDPMLCTTAIPGKADTDNVVNRLRAVFGPPPSIPLLVLGR